jgi:hypothetical protein
VREFCVDVDMVLESTRSERGHLSVQGEERDTIKSCGLRSRVVEEKGPSGHPVVRLYGSRTAILRYLKLYGDDGTYAERIQRIEK